MDDENDRPQYALPLTSPSAIKETQTTTTAFHSPKVLIVRTTLPSEDLENQKNAIPRIPEIKKPTPDALAITEKRHKIPSGIAQPKHPRQKTHNIVASALKARKFHLVSNPSSISSQFSNPKTLAQKHRKSRRKDLAVFVERIEKARKANAKTTGGPNSNGLQNITTVEKEDISQPVAKPRKLPNATAAERKWRTDNWANRAPKPDDGVDDGNGDRRTAESINEPSSRWDYSTKLAEQLQEVALEEMRASEERGKGINGGGGGKLKVKPKPPKPRRSKTEEVVEDGGADDDDDDVMTDTINLDDDDEGEYVLDTYIRSSAAEPFDIIAEPAASNHDSVDSIDIDHSNVGILVIENEEEEALWEAFAEDQEESDTEWNSEEEDENGNLFET